MRNYGLGFCVSCGIKFQKTGSYCIRCGECRKTYFSEYDKVNRERRRAYREDNREIRLKRQREYYSSNLEKIRKYRESNQGKIRKYGREYGEANRVKRRKYGREYYKENREKLIEKNRNRRKARAFFNLLAIAGEIAKPTVIKQQQKG